MQLKNLPDALRLSSLQAGCVVRMSPCRARL